MSELLISPNQVASYGSEAIYNHTYVGIDFGTSTTVVTLAYFDPNEKKIKTRTMGLNQKMADGAIYNSEKIPTMIAWYNNEILVGEGAKEIRLKREKNKNIWYAFKMDLGNKNDYLYAQSEMANTKMKLLNGRDAVTIFFKYLHQQINKYVRENNFPANIKYSISIPASFEPNQRRDMMDALKINGFQFNEQAFIDEPNAAFLSYIGDGELQKNIYLSDEFNTNILVFDYGAGTCDISILEVSLDNDQFNSSNIAISKFDFIGGKEVDKLIAVDILLPQLIEQNDLDPNFFTTSEQKKYIIPKLERFAEILKIQACEALSLAIDNIDLDTYENTFSLNTPVEFRTRRGTFTLQRPTMSYDEFRGVVDTFTAHEDHEIFRINKNERFVSIFKPITTALKKAKLGKDDIDYVLFIGGSAKNPLIQKTVKEYFDQSQYLIPPDLQAHVANGAAINSLLYNAFDKNIISPITSEPIFLIAKGESTLLLDFADDEDDEFDIFDEDEEYTIEKSFPIVGAGTPIPSSTFKISNLHISNNSQKQVELPICVTNKSNVIYNLVIPCDELTVNDNITLKVFIDANRTLHATAHVKGEIKNVTIEKVLSAPITAKERIEKAEHDYSRWVSENSGQESEQLLYKLYKMYEDDGEALKAAEIAEEINKISNRVSLNNIGLLYSDAGDSDKAIYCYKKHLEKSKSASVIFNLAHEYKYKDKNKYLDHLNECLSTDPSHGLARYELFCHKIGTNPSKENKQYLEDLFQEWKSDYESETYWFHISWLISCARQTGNHDFANRLKKEQITDSKDSLYNSQNLATVRGEV